jgi:hypothetical protein
VRSEKLLELPNQPTGEPAEIGGQARDAIGRVVYIDRHKSEIGILVAALHADCNMARYARVQAAAEQSRE